MERLTVGFSITALAVLACMISPTRAEQDSELQTILKRFPGYHLLTTQERDADLRAFWVRHFPKDNPSVVRADFNGDGNPDYALLLKNDKTGAAKLVVLMCSADGQCKSVYDLDETAYAGEVYLRPVTAGSKVSQTEAVGGNSPPVKLRTTGIQINYFEKGQVVLHWNSKLQKIVEIQTSD